MSLEIEGFGVPDQSGLGTNVTWPSVLALVSLNEPLTTFQRGELAQPVMFLPSLSRNLYTAPAPDLLVSGRFAVLAGGLHCVPQPEVEVRSHASGIGKTCESSLLMTQAGP